MGSTLWMGVCAMEGRWLASGFVAGVLAENEMVARCAMGERERIDLPSDVLGFAADNPPCKHRFVRSNERGTECADCGADVTFRPPTEGTRRFTFPGHQGKFTLRPDLTHVKRDEDGKMVLVQVFDRVPDEASVTSAPQSTATTMLTCGTRADPLAVYFDGSVD